MRWYLLNHVQNQQSVSVYFTKLKALGEELSNFCPVCSSRKFSYGGVQKLNAYIQMEYVMSFLWVLKIHLLKSEHNCFFLILFLKSTRFSHLLYKKNNEGSHIGLGGVDSVNNLAFIICYDASKWYFLIIWITRIKKKEHPFYTNCNFHGHTIEKCYKLHGYPTGYKPKQKAPSMTGN